MRVRRWTVALGLAGLVATCACAAVLAVGLRLSRPTPTAPGPPPSDLGAEAVRIPSASGSLLAGWWAPGRPGGGVVVLMHGAWTDRLLMLRRARVLRQHGFGALLFDFQAEGESPGRRITFGAKEALDAAAAVAFVRDRAPGERVGAIGISLGGAASVLGRTPLPVDALVLESVYPTIEAALSNRLHSALGPVLGRVTPLLVPLFQALLPPVLGVRADEMRPIEHIGGATAPLLIQSGTLDTRTPIDEARALAARAPPSARFRAVAGAGHEDLEKFDPAGYWAAVLPFLTEHLRPAPG